MPSKLRVLHQSVPAEVVALTCDTTGTLIASHYVNPETKIACIFGTGCNAAYMEKIGNIPKLEHLKLDPEGEMAINCEWVRRNYSYQSFDFIDTVKCRAPSTRLNMSICLAQNMTSS